jgi:RNA polymerase sigma-70 factor, ECF subfamily
MYCVEAARAVPPPLPAAAADEELLARAGRDREAFAELYRRHYGRIGTYLLRRTGDRAATEDLLAEVFLAALKGVRRFRWRGIGFDHWLYRVATRAANRWARARRRRFAPLHLACDVAARVSPEGADEVTAMLLSLPPRLQSVLSLHYIEGLAVDEVARVLGVRPGTVKSRLSRAREALKARFGGDA